MHRFALVAVFSAFVSTLAPSTFAQTPGRPHLDLVRGLRKENLPDLALQYLDQLKAGTPDPKTALLLDLE